MSASGPAVHLRRVVDARKAWQGSALDAPSVARFRAARTQGGVNHASIAADPFTSVSM